MFIRKTHLIRVAAVSVAALAFTTGCGEVTGPADSPEPASSPEDNADVSEITDGEIDGDDGGGDDEAGDDEGGDDGGGDDEGGDDASAEGDSDGEGSRDLADLAVLVKKQRQPVRDCYEKAKKKNPKLKGKMVIHFVLDPEGKVTSAKLNEERSEIKEPDLVACAIKVIKGIKFPASSKGMVTEVNYPYNFKP